MHTWFFKGFAVESYIWGEKAWNNSSSTLQSPKAEAVWDAWSGPFPLSGGGRGRPPGTFLKNLNGAFPIVSDLKLGAYLERSEWMEKESQDTLIGGH